MYKADGRAGALQRIEWKYYIQSKICGLLALRAGQRSQWLRVSYVLASTLLQWFKMPVTPTPGDVHFLLTSSSTRTTCM